MPKWFALVVQVAAMLAFVAAVGHAQERRANPLRPQASQGSNAPVAHDVAERDKLCGQAMQLATGEQWEDAIQVARQAMQIQRILGPWQPEAFAILESLAVWQDRAAHYSAAAETWSELEQLSAQVRGEEHWSTVCASLFAKSCRKAAEQSPRNQQRLAQASVLSFGADQQMAAEKFVEARDLARQSMEIRSELFGVDDVVTAISGHTLGTALLASGDAPKAQPILEQCGACREKQFGMNNPYTLATFTSLAALCPDCDLACSEQSDCERFGRSSEFVKRHRQCRNNEKRSSGCRRTVGEPIRSAGVLAAVLLGRFRAEWGLAISMLSVGIVFLALKADWCNVES